VAGNDGYSAPERLMPRLEGEERAEAAGGVVLADEPAADDLIASELLVEEISIDGMCGVY
jgi:mycofactocin precursor